MPSDIIIALIVSAAPVLTALGAILGQLAKNRRRIARLMSDVAQLRQEVRALHDLIETLLPPESLPN